MAPLRAFMHFPQSIRILSTPTVRYVSNARPFSSTIIPREGTTEGGSRNPQKDAQKDREKINTDANEYAKSGTDDTAAKNEEAAFDPNITTPEGAKEKAGEGNEENPLDVSPANQKISEGTQEDEGGAKDKGSL